KTSGAYSVKVTDVTGCFSSDTISVTVSNGPAANFSFTASGLTVTFTNNSLEGASYFWDFDDGTTLLTNMDTAVVHTYAAAGSYDVSLFVTNPCGVDSFFFTVTVTLIGIAENKVASEQINIYPNPNEGVFTISFTGFENEKVQLTILDLQGRSVVNEQLTVNSEFNKEIDLSRLPKGMYFMRANTTDKVFTRKVLVE
ncbi:MAG: T9SS type A sorting domain-containing protein, partial [Bacteroidetes bacterium]|nr:T9SS type A sorting domain-containing protein [Bacteroidota bacterium]